MASTLPTISMVPLLTSDFTFIPASKRRTVSAPTVTVEDAPLYIPLRISRTPALIANVPVPDTANSPVQNHKVPIPVLVNVCEPKLSMHLYR